MPNRLRGAGKTADNLQQGTDGDAHVRDFSNKNSASAIKSVSSSAVTASAGASNLTNRKAIVITPIDGSIRWRIGDDPTASNGHLLDQGQSGCWALGSSLNLRIISTTGIVNYAVDELA